MLLAVDTSTRYAGVALFDAPGPEKGRVLASRSWYSAVNHTSELMPAVSQVLEDQKTTLEDLTGIAVALGPGGFSALRVGLSVVKGLAVTAGKPVVGVGTLDLEAHPYLNAGLPVCALLDAGRNEVASARFDPAGQRICEDTVGTPEQLLEQLTGALLQDRESGNVGNLKTLFCGEGVINWGEFIRDNMKSQALVIESTPASRLWSLCRMGGSRLAEGNLSDLATLQPLYLRMPSIGVPKRRDRTPQQR